MKSYTEHLQIVNTFELGETIAAAQFLIENTDLHTQTLKVLNSEKSKTNLIWCFGWTTNYSDTGQYFWISATFNAQLTPTWDDSWHKKTEETLFMIKRENGRLIMKCFSWTIPQVPELSQFHKRFFANKALSIITEWRRHAIANKIKSKNKSRPITARCSLVSI
jgi:hypothetical protein